MIQNHGAVLRIDKLTIMAARCGRRGQILSAKERRELLKKLEEKSDDDSLSSLSIQQAPSNRRGAAPSPHRRVSPHKHQDGCRACGEDDDHKNLMYCDMCDNEYHYYCLDPPLRAVPKGDWFCNACKPQTKTHIVPLKEDDGLDPMVCALPPRYTERFGEICWAQGGNGFGWWPACIYDPRLTVGGARELARKNLGRRHLVYFFECLIAPFSVLGDGKLVSWEQGIADGYHLGRTAQGHSKPRGKMFQQALHIACLEEGKPVDTRMIWNHQGDEPVEHIPLSPPVKRQPKKRTKEPSDENKPDKKRRRKDSKRPSSPARHLFQPPDELFCRVAKRSFDTSDKEIDESLGFFTLGSNTATFLDAREAIQNEMDPDSLPKEDWKFYLPNLGPVSHRQEAKLGPVAVFLHKTFDVRLGDGSVDKPFQIVIVAAKPRR